MTTLVVSDLHLEESRPAMTRLFVDLLARERDVEHLLILGDLFEAWIGDDDDAPLGRQVAAAIAAFARRGARCSFIHGNRDFLIGREFCAAAQMELLDDGVVLELEGVPTLLMHGDSLCVDDVGYQQFRRQVRDPAWQHAFLAQPLVSRRAFAAHARAESSKHTKAADVAIMDVSAVAVSDAMSSAGVRRLVHGHTHRPGVHAFELDGAYAERIVLGDWYRSGSVLRIDSGRVSLERLGV